MNEFTLIKQYFASQALSRPDVLIGIGDDAAITLPPPNQTLAITTDTLVAGVHFPLNTLPHDIGHKSLAVNLSDLAAMGAEPAWVTLALTLPEADESWLESFSQGFFALANEHNVALIGGDTTHGPLSITVQAIGFTPMGKAITRNHAKVGDLIYVSGSLGDAALALTMPELTAIQDRLHRPQPRIELGIALRAFATAAIDISDGLASDLKHILEKSQVGALICVDQIPLSDTLKSTLSKEKAIELALTGGDDYELCFTIPASKRSEFENQCNTPCHCIGMITDDKNLNLHYQDGSLYHGKQNGYHHF